MMIKRSFIMAACLLLAACGGGDSKSSSQMYTVTTKANTGGSFGVASVQVAERHSTSVSLTTDGHYNLVSVLGCGGKLSDPNTFITGAVLTDCQITATFEPKSYSVKVASSSGGSAVVMEASVVYNEVGRFQFAADPGYHLKSVDSTCGGSLASLIFSTDKVSADCLLTPHFEADSTSVEAQTYVVTVLSAIGGTPSPATQSVAENDHAKVDFIIDEFYSLISVTSSCGGTLVDKRFTTGKVTANCTLQPNFKASSNVITPSIDPSELATISGSVAEGATLAVGGAAFQTGAVKGKLVLAYCKDGKSFIGNPITDANGYYTGQLRKSSLPCALQVNANSGSYYSLVYGDVSTVNITPLTSLVIAYGAAKDPLTFYSTLPGITVSEYKDAQVALATKLQARGYSLPAGDFLPLNTAFAPGDSWDKLIDQLALSLKSANVSFSSLQTAFVSGNLDKLPAASQ